MEVKKVLFVVRFSFYNEVFATMDKKFVLVEPHILEQLQSPQTNMTQGDLKSSDDMLRLSLLDNLQRQEETLANSGSNAPRNNKDSKVRYKHTCSYCGRMFAKGLNCRRHLALIHGVDISGRPVCDETLRRYRGYNQKRPQCQQNNRKDSQVSSESEGEPDYSYFGGQRQTNNNSQMISEIDVKTYFNRVLKSGRQPATRKHPKSKRTRCSTTERKWINY